MDYQSIFYIVLGYNKMGYSQESLKLINECIANFTINEKKITPEEITAGCYVLNSISDYFVHTRDIDYIRENFNFIKNIAQLLHKESTSIKKIEDLRLNSIENFIPRTPHYSDLALVAFTLSQYAYLSRCMGIFGDEIKFTKESERISGIFISYIDTIDYSNFKNEFFYYDIFAGFPFAAPLISPELLQRIISLIYEHFEDFPLYVKSLGLDIFASLILAVNQSKLKDERVIEILNWFISNNKRFNLPDFVDPTTKRGIRDNGSSKVNSSLFFIFARNMLFTDAPNRLDLFPVPVKEWFRSGDEINIQNAPSRFGLINIKVISTANEIHVHFEDLPKFVPPDIMINLPCKTKIIQADDFIVKKGIGNAYIINGWPSQVRFIRK